MQITIKSVRIQWNLLRRMAVPLLLAGALFLCPAPSRATNVIVDCAGLTAGAFTTLQSAIDSLDYTGPHTITMLNGNIANCVENVFILDRQRITFQPQIPGFGVTVRSPNGDNAVKVFGSTGIVFTEVGFAGSSNGLVIDRGSEVQALGCTISGNANNGVLVRGNSTLRIAAGLIQNNGNAGVNVTASGSLTVDSETLIQNNRTGVHVINSSSARIFAPASIINNSVAGINAGESSSIRLFGDPDTPSPVSIEGNALIGINTFGGHVVMFGPVRIRNNGSSGGQFHAGVRSDDNALIVAVGSGDVDISNNFGPGIEATNGGTLDISGATISNNTEDGIRLLGNSQVAFYPPNTNVFTGNGGRSILCDNSSWFFGDVTGLYGFMCRVAEFRGRPHRSWMDNSPREEKPVPYIPRWRKR